MSAHDEYRYYSTAELQARDMFSEPLEDRSGCQWVKLEYEYERGVSHTFIAVEPPPQRILTASRLARRKLRRIA